MQNGFRILRVEPNIKFKEKDVYVFKQSKKLSDCIFEYINLRTKEKNYGDINKRSRS